MATRPKEDITEEFADEAEVLDHGDQQSGGDEPELSEDFARSVGWKPLEEFTGKPEEWKDWADFLDTEQANAPQLRQRNKVMLRRVDQAEKRAKNAEKAVNELKSYYERSEQRAYERALNELKAQQRAAVTYSDPDAFDRAQREIDQLEKDRDTARPSGPQEGERAFMRWHAKRGWYGKDSQKTAAVDAVFLDMGPYHEIGMEPSAYLDEVERRAKEEFPEAFMDAHTMTPRRTSAVGGVETTRRSTGAETFDNLPSDAKAQFRRFEQMGTKISKDDFARDAWAVIKAEKRA